MRRDLWKEETKLDAQYRHAQEQLKNAERAVGATMDRVRFSPPPREVNEQRLTLPPCTRQDTAQGLRAAKAIAARLNLDGYHGPLYELFTVEDRYKTAVEVTAGTR